MTTRWLSSHAHPRHLGERLSALWWEKLDKHPFGNRHGGIYRMPLDVEPLVCGTVYSLLLDGCADRSTSCHITVIKWL